MIQVCGQCGTRWNVRDRQRVWCPRCHGTLLAPTSGTSESVRPPVPGRASPQGLPPGYRWIAVRPGSAPPPRRGRRPLGPTPRYAATPRWGLVEQFDIPVEQQVSVRKGPPAAVVSATLVTAMAVLGLAALVHIVRYVLLLINRSVLLNPVVAAVATWGGVAVSVLAAFAVVASLVVLMNWLIARRSIAFARRGATDPRSVWALRAGCLVPLANLLWAPTYVVELARTEGRYSPLRRSIVAWWVVWFVSTVISLFSIATSFTSDPQRIADNTVTTTMAYLFALAAILLASRVYYGFERAPAHHHVIRYVVVAADQSPAAVETPGQNPAA